MPLCTARGAGANSRIWSCEALLGTIIGNEVQNIWYMKDWSKKKHPRTVIKEDSIFRLDQIGDPQEKAKYVR
jgi:hypothetical protein